MSEYFDRVSLQVQKGFHRIASVKPRNQFPVACVFCVKSGQLDITLLCPGSSAFTFNTGDAGGLWFADR